MTDKERERSYEHYRQWQINKSRYRSECIAYVLLFGIGLFFVIEHWQGVCVALGIGLMLVAIYLGVLIFQKWNKKNKALSELKKMAINMGARDIEIDNKTGQIAFVIDEDEVGNGIEEMKSHLADKGLHINVHREKCKGDGTVADSKTGLGSTNTGYVNKNNQRNNGKTDKPGTDNNQFLYEMECLNCGEKYYANGSDIWQRKCPSCQGGRP